MWEDPIVAEVRRVREQLSAQFGHDLDAIFADLQKRQAALGDRLVSRKKQPEPTSTAVADSNGFEQANAAADGR